MKSYNMDGLKEAGRLVLLAVVSYLLTAGVLAQLLPLVGVNLDMNQQLLVIGFLTTLLKGVDEALHEKGKETNDPKLVKGLTQF